MSAYKTIILDDIKYKLIPLDEDEMLTAKELSKKVKYSTDTIYKKIKLMTPGVHYNKLENGTIRFNAVNAIAFFKENPKGKHNESKQRDSLHKEGQSLSISELLDQQKESLLQN